MSGEPDTRSFKKGFITEEVAATQIPDRQDKRTAWLEDACEFPDGLASCCVGRDVMQDGETRDDVGG